MIVDAFMFRDELDLLEARFVEYFDLVDRFVIVEGELQFGDAQPKPLWFAEHRERFAPFADKIAHVVVVAAGFPSGDGWAREAFQRNSITAGLSGLAANDLVMIGDVDEFPAPKDVAAGLLGTSVMRHHVYAPNLEHPTAWCGTVTLPLSAVDTPQRVREHRALLPRHSGGHHFSWHPGAQSLTVKAFASAHVEFADNDPAAGRDACCCHWDRTPLAMVDIDDTWPEWFRTSMPDWWLR